MIQELQDRIKTLETRLAEAWSILALDARKEEIDALEVEVTASDFWADQERARGEMQKLSDLKDEYQTWNNFKSELQNLKELLDMAEAENDESVIAEAESKITELESAFGKMEFTMLLSGSHDASNAVMSIHAGAGGTDAQDWAEMLMRMYFRYAETKGWRVKLVDESRGGEAGIKSATFFVQGRHAYGHLKCEAGVHRLVRQSPFNADALRQTSFALVEVIPELDEKVEIKIKPEDLRIDTFMSGGKGGQSVNTTYSAVRIVHKIGRAHV